jgi:hypothetical protein
MPKERKNEFGEDVLKRKLSVNETEDQRMKSRLKNPGRDYNDDARA